MVQTCTGFINEKLQRQLHARGAATESALSPSLLHIHHGMKSVMPDDGSDDLNGTSAAVKSILLMHLCTRLLLTEVKNDSNSA